MVNKILIVEDDLTIAKIVAMELEGWGYATEYTTVFSQVMEDFHRFAPEMVLLDLSLPYRSGFHWCAEIRKESNVPIVFISSAADNMNMVTALHQGADDFIPKPFDLNVLVAKVQALFRRSYAFAGEQRGLQCRGASLDQAAMALDFAGERIELSRNEYRILHTLMKNMDKVVSRQEIIKCLWEDEHFIDDNTLTVNINRLRRKLAQAGLPDFITTRKGEGYMVSSQ